ncbi:hypothetical protein [Bifidobacterium sp. ESL0732]|uniref:hypothetical protein n=1 Tax=Bifidobacterium sp. ESL0732 TaxID=2983222 RepID=UPI0023F85BAC|nr:hypothetical protein [Bifidobacterium sp. ESL0732]WEV64286.1 hypothetical protein OZX70_01430 [Bifidobacterium sp. ESL0732]
MSQRKSQAIANMEAAEQQYLNEKKAYDKALADANLKLMSSQHKHKKSLKRTDKALDNAREELHKPVSTVGDAKLYWDHVEYEGRSMALEKGMTAEVHASGNVYVTAETRGKVGVSVLGAAVGGVVAGKLGAVAGGKKNKVETKNSVHDKRNLFIVLQTSNNALSIQCDPDHEDEARKFADHVIRSSSNMDGVKQDNEDEIAELEKELDAVKNDTGDIERAQQNVQYYENNKAAMQNAYSVYQQAMAYVPKPQLQAYQKNKSRIKTLKVIFVILVVLMFLYIVFFL